MFIKRHKLTKDDGSGFFAPSDFAVGELVTIYGRAYHLVDADSFTREWYKTHLGQDFPAPLGYPDDPVDQYRATFGLTRGPKGEPGASSARMPPAGQAAAWRSAANTEVGRVGSAG